MKVGVSSYSFSHYMKTAGADVFQVIDKAKEIGFSSIEFISTYAPSGKDPVAQARDIRSHADAAGIDISSYTIGADLLNHDPETEFEYLKGQLHIAGALGVSRMRHDITGGFPPSKKTARGFDDCIPIVAPLARKVSEYARDLGIRTMFENHGFFCQDSDRVEKLLNAVNSDNFGLLLDMGNFLCADDHPAQATGKLIPYLTHVHIKDFFVKDGQRPDPGAGWFRSRAGNYLRGTIVGHGDVPVVQCLKLIANSAYQGNYSIEFEGCEETVFALKTGLAFLNAHFPDKD